MRIVRSSRRRFLLRAGRITGVAWLAATGTRAMASPPEFTLLGAPGPEGSPPPLIPAPEDRGRWPEWRRQLHQWRATARRALEYDDTLYRRPDLEWTVRCFACGFVMMGDERFLDPRTSRFTVESFLDVGAREFGGYDALVLWHAYPRIGFDDRNQFDFYRDLPGGWTGLRELSARCHARGVRVFVNYNPWDTGTRREGKSDLDALVDLVAAIDADGIFLDTLHRGDPGFRQRLDAARPGVALESELALPLEGVADHHLSWAQWFHDSPAPGVLRNKWLERRHLLHQIQRWNRDHTAELHTAWMNGCGMLIWENVFGSWVGWSARDRSILRAMLPVQRRHAALFAGEGWTPLIPTLNPEVHASLWEQDGLRLWTLVNRADRIVEGPLLQIQLPEGFQLHDLIRGRPAPLEGSGALRTLSGRLEPRGLGGFLAGPPTIATPDFDAFLRAQRALDARARFDTESAEPTVVLLSGSPTHPGAAIPDGMIDIPEATLTLTSEFRTRECGFYESVPPAGRDWGPLNQPRRFTRKVHLGRFAIDRTPVTNREFARFLTATGYQPRHPERFLHHWTHGIPPAGCEDHPVVHVGLDDARAYAAWAGKRLPTEEEWQYAAAGPDALEFPWGNEWLPEVCNDGTTVGTTPVTAFPGGRSPFGCLDLCGNVWHWTESERTDGRTRFCILKGGSWYRAQGSHWYADGGPQPCRFAAKFLLIWPGLDRCATIGFRCVIDLAAVQDPAAIDSSQSQAIGSTALQ